MAPSEGWHPDPTGRHPHRYWDGEAWTSRVFTSGAEAHDPLPVKVPSGQKLWCGICHAPTRHRVWTGRCHRCTLPLTSAYIAARPQQELKPATLVLAAQVSFDDALAEVDQAIAAGDDATALRRLDTAVAYGTVLRAVAGAAASSTKARKPAEPLTLSALIELRVQALRLHAKFAGAFTPEGFELTLLLRLAAMYAPDGRDDLPGTTAELLAFCASRVEWIEAECRQVNEVAADYAEVYDWMSLRVALARLGYEIEERRTIGNGPFAPGERGRREAAAVLGVDADGHASVIKKAYYREAAKHHPDRLAEAPEDLRRAAEERMKEINAAYELLTA